MVDRGDHDAFGARQWVERLTASLPVAAAVLDLGCGGGEPIARFLIDRGCGVTGVDLAASQIALAATRFPRHRWLRGDLRHIALDETFDAVIAWNSLTWLDRAEHPAVVARMAAWLHPGGRLLFSAAADHDPARDQYRAGSPYHADLEAADWSAALARSGLVTEAHVAADAACGDAGVWLARKP